MSTHTFFATAWGSRAMPLRRRRLPSRTRWPVRSAFARPRLVSMTSASSRARGGSPWRRSGCGHALQRGLASSNPRMERTPAAQTRCGQHSTRRSGRSYSRVLRSARRASTSTSTATRSSTGTCRQTRSTWSSVRAEFTGTRGTPSARTSLWRTAASLSPRRGGAGGSRSGAAGVGSGAVLSRLPSIIQQPSRGGGGTSPRSRAPRLEDHARRAG
jgi:hypothetical protein